MRNRRNTVVQIPANNREAPANRQLVVVRPALPAAPPQFQRRIEAPQGQSLWSYYLGAFRERWRTRIDGRTSRIAIPALRTQGEQLKLAHEYQTTLNSMRLAEIERETKAAELNQKRTEAIVAQQQQQALQNLRLQKEKLSIQVEMAKLKKEMADLKRKPDQQVSPTQQRLLKRGEIEEKLQRLRADEERAMNAAPTEAERRRIQNMYEHRREQLMEELSRYL
jgi:hypothetical protein